MISKLDVFAVRMVSRAGKMFVNATQLNSSRRCYIWIGTTAAYLYRIESNRLRIFEGNTILCLITTTVKYGWRWNMSRYLSIMKLTFLDLFVWIFWTFPFLSCFKNIFPGIPADALDRTTSLTCSFPMNLRPKSVTYS